MLETLIALAITLGVSGAVFGMLSPASGHFLVQPEAADMQQRLRVGHDALYKDLISAGAGPFITDGTSHVGPLTFGLAPVLPFRPGVDPPGTFAGAAITIVYVAPAAAHTTVAADSFGSTVTANPEPDCPVGQSLCDFSQGTSVLLFDDRGSFDVGSVSFVDHANVRLTLAQPLSVTYHAGAWAVEAVERSYFLKADAANNLYQLMTVDGSTGSAAPVIDHAVGLAFEYYGDPEPPQLVRPLTDPTGPWTTYGPKPPLIGVAGGTAYPPGENCGFAVQNGAPLQQPRLAVLDSGGNPGALVRLDAPLLTDGPWCPDAQSTNRWDADLLRIRKIVGTLRVEAAADALRGPASLLFARGGTSRSANRWLPDREIRFQVSPRNLNVER